MAKARISQLEKAILMATRAHAGQTDKAGAPYILHPLRVMLAQTSDDARITALLHDVVEDNADWTIDRLRNEGFNERVLEAVATLTKSDDADYFDYVDRIAANALAVQVKLADLADNLDVERLGRPPTLHDLKRLDRYEKARARLIGGPD